MVSAANNWLHSLQEVWQNPGDMPAGDFPKTKLLKLHAASPWAAEKLGQQLPWLIELWARLRTDSPPAKDELERQVEKADLDTGLRHFRNREMLRIIWRDINEQAEITETLHDLSLLAEICTQYALDKLHGQLSGQHGEPLCEGGSKARFVVLAMGKLGGGELNLSSDIDLIFFHTGHGRTAGNKLSRGRISNEQFFNRLGQRLIKCLSSIQASGFVFRVDTRLRPHGQSGPLVPSVGALEQYYQTEGRDWERYALIKARPVAGDIASGNELLEQLRPFIYRRYLDYGAIESLREMHQMIRLDADKISSKSTLGIDLKRGSGGIREAEFFVQSFQLLRGGRNPELRQTSFLASLEALVTNQLLETDNAEALLRAYIFLRRLENRLQALHDQQIHHLPSSPEDQQALTCAMGLSSWPLLLEKLQLQQQTIQRLFSGLFNTDTPRDKHSPRYPALIQGDWQQAGIQLAADEQDALAVGLQQLEKLPLSQRARERSQRLLEKVLEINTNNPLGIAVWQDLLTFITAVSRRSAYLALLIEHPHALERLLQLFTQSEWLAAEVIRYPVLLDDLIDPKVNQPASQDEMQASLRRLVSNSDDNESLLENFNQYKRGQQLRIATAELSGELNSRDAQHFLSDLADTILQACLDAVSALLEQRHGVVDGLAWAVIAYGSLGAREMTYESDLDLVFLYQLNSTGVSPDELTSDGDKVLGVEQYASRIGQRLIAFLTTLTPAGRLYSVDSRLRPNGKAGTLVSRVDAFARYQENQAWLWEHQALTRARAVCGNRLVSDRFKEIRISTLSKTHTSINKLRAEVVAMRHKMRAQLEVKTRYQQLKHAPGGLGDIEFIAQYGILANAAGNRQLLLPHDTAGQLETLRQCGLLDNTTTRQLIDAWMQLSRSRQQLTLQRTTSGNIAAEDALAMSAVQAIWERIMEQGED